MTKVGSPRAPSLPAKESVSTEAKPPATEVAKATATATATGNQPQVGQTKSAAEGASSTAPGDVFTQGAEVTSLPGQAPVSLDSLSDLMQLATSLGYELTGAAGQLVNGAPLSEKANRLMQLAVPWAQRFSELKKPTQDGATQAEARLRFLQPLMAMGLGQMVESVSRQPAMHFVKQMLDAPSAAEAKAVVEGLNFETLERAAQTAAASSVQANVTLELAAARRALEADEELSDGKARSKKAEWAALLRSRTEWGRALDEFKQTVSDHSLAAWAVGVLSLGMLLSALLSLLR